MVTRLLLLCLLVASCSSIPPLDNNIGPIVKVEKRAKIGSLINEELGDVGKPVQQLHKLHTLT